VKEAAVTTHATRTDSGETQAKRLERVYEEVAKLLGEPRVASRLRTPPGASEWSAMQALGHMTEMIPYWLTHCRTLIAATGAPPTFGRTAGSPERLAGVARGASADPDALLRQLHESVRTAASVIRQLSAAERAKRGISTERGDMTVAQVIESFIVDHAEEHLVQVQGALRA
jgi:DinB superfamily